LIKKVAKLIFFNRPIARIAISPLLRFHNFSYRWTGVFSAILNNGVHPKHRILQYKEWFLDNIEPGWVVLDIGSNTGMLPFLLAEKANFVYGIDINQDYVDTAVAQRSKENIKYICADITKMEQDLDKPINCITLSNVLEHIEDRAHFLKALISSTKWASPSEKHFLIRVPLFDREWIVQYKKELGVEYRLDRSHFIEYTYDGFIEEMTSAGIKVVDLKIHYGEIYAVCQA